MIPKEVLEVLQMYFDEKIFDNSLRQALGLRLECGLGLDTQYLEKILSCQKFGQIHIFRNPKNAPIGYMLYAHISKYTLGVISSNPQHQLKAYEYDEGKLFYLLDVCFSLGDRVFGLQLLKERLLKERILTVTRRGSLSLYSRNQGTFKRRRLTQYLNNNELKFSLLNKAPKTGV